MEFEVEVVSMDTIKPSTPTPPHLRRYTLGWADQLARVYHLPVAFFYPASSRTPAAAERIRVLKSSLPRALSRFYPLAGELVLNSHVRCCDAGARFLEARADADLADFLRGLDRVQKLLPCARSCSAEGALLSVQATAFRCGGLALGVCASHKILDGRSLFLFLQSWASAAAPAPAPDPVFDGAALFPPSEDVVPEKDQPRPPGAPPLARKGFVIDGPKVAALRSGLPSSTTRVQAVCALLWRCALRARPPPARARASVASLLVDTRPRMAPPAPDASFGNRCFSAGAAAAKATAELVLARSGAARGVLEEELGRSVKMMNTDHTQKLREPDGHSSAYALIVDGVIRSRGFEGFDHYFFSSWLSLPLYEVDFGWGRPAWVATTARVRNLSVLLPRSPEVDPKGVEVWMTMEESEMAEFEKDEELLEFAVPFRVATPPPS